MEQNETKKMFSGKQREAAEMLANPDFNGTITELIQTVGVARSTFYRWIDNPDYMAYINSLIDKYTDSELSTVWKALIRECSAGNIQAIKLYFELKGKYKQQVDISGGVIFIGGEDDIPD